MKKIVSIILALLMLFSFAACGESAKTPASGPDNSNPSGTDVNTPKPAEPSAPADGGTVGWYTDNVDYTARDAYDVVYLTIFLSPGHANLGEAMKQWGEKLNINVSYYGADEDSDKLLTMLETYISQGVDGIVIDEDIFTQDKILETLTDSGIPFMTGLTPITDAETGKNLAINSNINPQEIGAIMAQWDIENYKNYWGDVDMSKTGVIYFDTSFNPETCARREGYLTELYKTFPELESNFFLSDFTGISFEEQAYNDTSAIVAAHPEIEHWFMAAGLQDYGVGVARACEALDIDDKVIMTTYEAGILISEWENGYDGAWKAAIHVDPMILSEPIMCGLLAQMDGRATAEQLYPEFKGEGETYASVRVDKKIVDKSNYKEYVEQCENYINGNY